MMRILEKYTAARNRLSPSGVAVVVSVIYDRRNDDMYIFFFSNTTSPAERIIRLIAFSSLLTASHALSVS
jgi:hypothetical protein